MSAFICHSSSIANTSVPVKPSGALTPDTTPLRMARPLGCGGLQAPHLLRLKCVLCQSTTHPRFRLRTASARSTPRGKHRSVDGAGLRVHVERRIDSFELTMVATTTRGAVNASPCAQSAKPSPLPPPLSRLSHPPLTEGVSRARTAATRKECVLGACARKRERRVNSNVKAFGCCPSAR